MGAERKGGRRGFHLPFPNWNPWIDLYVAVISHVVGLFGGMAMLVERPFGDPLVKWGFVVMLVFGVAVPFYFTRLRPENRDSSP